MLPYHDKGFVKEWIDSGLSILLLAVVNLSKRFLLESESEKCCSGNELEHSSRGKKVVVTSHPFCCFTGFGGLWPGHREA